VVVFGKLGKLKESKEMFELLDGAFPKQPDLPTLRLMTRYAGHLLRNGKLEDARHWLQSACDGFREFVGENHHLTLLAIFDLACVLCRLDRYIEALEKFQTLVGPDSPRIDDILKSLASVYSALGGDKRAAEYTHQLQQQLRNVTPNTTEIK